MMNKEIQNFIIYFGINLLYIILNCIKDIFRQKGTRTQSMVIATISSTIYVILIKKLVDMDYTIIITGTILANMLGDRLGRIIGEYLIPRGIVCYRFTICKERNDLDTINTFLENNDFGYKWEEAHSLHNDYLSYQIYTQNREEDKQIENLLIEHKIDKYNKTETKNTANL